ncbi:hypothetical protein [Burkholderia sp. MBR-1]|uniref:hypothetical protein n=1 Tax=Burkholderia sp. MBR-1 TaxID=2732364 RepID=UPI0015EF9355|nr:hypothetical protein [Burkholderia sp. MBR-1]QMI49787.1 hypothetical protein MBR110_30420 [Burkholderia sp. MBR-1]
MKQIAWSALLSSRQFAWHKHGLVIVSAVVLLGSLASLCAIGMWPLAALVTAVVGAFAYVEYSGESGGDDLR